MREKKGFWELRDKQGRNTWAEEKYTTAQVFPSGGTSFRCNNFFSAKVSGEHVSSSGGIALTITIFSPKGVVSGEQAIWRLQPVLPGRARGISGQDLWPVLAPHRFYIMK